MTSDEIIQKSLDYLHSQKVHDKLVNAINDNDISSILDVVQDGYTQGRADALKELEQLKREAFESGQNSIVMIERVSFNDYLKQRKES